MRTTRTVFCPGSCSTGPPCAAALPAARQSHAAQIACFDSFMVAKRPTAATRAAVDASEKTLSERRVHRRRDVRLGLRSRGSVHVDVTLVVDAELRKRRHERAHVIVRGLRAPALGRVHREVALEQDLLLREVRDRQRVRVRRRIDVIELDRARAIGVDALVFHGVDTHATRIPRQRVIEQRARRVQRPSEELDGILLRDHRCTLGHHGRDTGRVVAMRMAVPHIADRLARELPLDLVDVELGTRLILAGLEHHDVVVELGDDRVVAALPRRVAPEPWAELFLRERQSRRLAAGRTAAGRRACGRRRLRRQRCDIGRIAASVRHVDLEERPTAARLLDLRRH